MEDNNKKYNCFALVYKLLVDVVYLCLLSFVFLIVADSILPGFVSSRINFTGFVILILTLISFIYYIGKKYNFEFTPENNKKNWIIPVLVIISPLIILSLIKFAIWQILVLFAISSAVFIPLYKNIFSD